MSELEPRDYCPDCGSPVEVESATPLEEYCIGIGCDYYRAKSGDGVIRE